MVPPCVRTVRTLQNLSRKARNQPTLERVSFRNCRDGYSDSLSARPGSGLWRFRLLRCDPKGLDLQTLVRIESLLAVQTLYELSCGLANRSSDAAGIDSYRPALGANIAVFVFQSDVIRIQSDLP